MRAAAAGTEVVSRDALPGQGGIDSGAQGGHRADPLVARYEGVALQAVVQVVAAAVVETEVRAAQTEQAHPDQHLARAGLGRVDLRDRHRAGAGEQDGFHRSSLAWLSPTAVRHRVMSVRRRVGEWW